jgi:putative transposase
MARLPRLQAPDVPMHIIQRGNNRTATFHDDRDRCRFLDLLASAANEYGLEIHALVLMSNHVHVLATPRDVDSASRTMQAVGRSYVVWFNRKYGRTGTLWEGRFRATVVDTDRYFLACMRYVEENPPRAGLVDAPADYRWSSHHANALGVPIPYVTPHPVYLGLGRSDESRRAAYRRLFEHPVSGDELAAIRRATHSAWALGDETFIRRVEELAGRRALPLRRCRYEPRQTGPRSFGSECQL